MKALLSSALPKIAMTMFVHFKSPVNGEPLYIMEEKEIQGVPTMVRAKDDEGKEMPVGVMMYTPGSKMFRTAANMNATENIRGGKKEVSGEKVDKQGVNLLARTAIKPVGFELEGGNNYDAWFSFFDADENVVYRDQVAEEQADLGKSYVASAKA